MTDAAGLLLFCAIMALASVAMGVAVLVMFEMAARLTDDWQRWRIRRAR